MALDWLQGKSPKMWVNEIGVKQLRQPKWETREAHPGQQPPTFICTCTISYSDKNLQSEGIGKTKKEAEQEAALEMLKTKLMMTPAKLQELNNSSKRKSGSSSSGLSSSRNSGSSLPSLGDNDHGDDGFVSDTDEDEMNKAEMNPVSELLAICDQAEFQDPEYDEVSSEGPPHKKIFTMRCSIPELGISCTGRRYQKKIAKRLAAFRALREVKKRGFKYSVHTDDKDSPNGSISGSSFENTDSSGDKSEDRSKREIVLHNGDAVRMSKEDFLRLENISIGEQLLSKVLSTGSRRYCNEKSEKCVEHCVNYGHTFEHLKKSETLDKILAMSSSESFNQFGGPMSALTQIAQEIGMKLTIYCDPIVNGRTVEDIVSILEIQLPFKFKCKVPKKVMVHALGHNERAARDNVAVIGIEWLRSAFI